MKRGFARSAQGRLHDIEAGSGPALFTRELNRVIHLAGRKQAR